MSSHYLVKLNAREQRILKSVLRLAVFHYSTEKWVHVWDT